MVPGGTIDPSVIWEIDIPTDSVLLRRCWFVKHLYLCREGK